MAGALKRVEGPAPETDRMVGARKKRITSHKAETDLYL